MKYSKTFVKGSLLMGLLLSGLLVSTSNVATAYARPAQRNGAATVRLRRAATATPRRATSTRTRRYVANHNGVSARAAAFLKTSPPAGWISHYLPDDRYKVAGGIWKYVSTEIDTYYHRPSSREMLAQAPDNVIGFASAADAEEAGYWPGPSITTSDRRTGWIGGQPGSGGSSGSGTGSNSNTLSIPESEIPEGVLACINLVDFIADKIENASSRSELTDIIVNTLQIRDDFQQGDTAQYLQGKSIPRLQALKMTAFFNLLVRAARNKRSPGVVPAVGRSASAQEIRAARDGVRDLIPQVAAARTRMTRNAIQANGLTTRSVMEGLRRDARR